MTERKKVFEEIYAWAKRARSYKKRRGRMKVKEVYIWSNGNIMVFDENDKQIADLQKNNIFDLRAIKEASDKDTLFYLGWRGQSRTKLDVAWIFEKEGLEEVKK